MNTKLDGKRFGKCQRMRGSKGGAQLMLQTRTRTPGGTPREIFEQWSPSLKTRDTTAETQPCAA